MRLWGYLPLLASAPLAHAAQISFQQGSNSLSSNIVDKLSQDPDYTCLLKLLQRAKLIPTLNKLNGSTLFAPTNDAIKKRAAVDTFWQSALADEDKDLHDNIQEKLRQELFYHLLNYTLSDDMPKEGVETLETLHYPRTPVEPPSNEPPPYPPWMPIPGGTLGGKPQRLRRAVREEAEWIGVDAFGQNGARVVDRTPASNGVVVKMNQVLVVPPDLATVISTHPSLSYLRNILTPELVIFLNGTSELTTFLPMDEAWQALPHYERLYLESKYATDDLTTIVNLHAVASKHVVYAESFETGVDLTTIEGRKIHITQSEDGKKTNISSAELIERDIYASNGVIHTISSLLVPPDALRITPEKYLLALNCSSFVDLIHSVGLTSLINDTETHWTILAPQDDVISMFDNGELPPRGSSELKKMLQYHFIPGKKAPKKLFKGMLLETALKESGLGGGRQVLSVDVHGDGPKDSKKDKSVGFGGASTIGDPVEINNTLIYFISHPLVPPADALTTALPQLDLSSFLAAVFSTNLAEKLKFTPRTTLLIPHNSAFKRLGALVSAHLLSASSKSDLEKVIQHHVITGVEYAESLQNGTARTFATLEGSDLHAERPKDSDSVILTGSGGWTDMHSLLHSKNYLTQTGVIHELSDIMIPRSVDISIGKLMSAAKSSTMTSLVTKAGLEWILNGTNPKDGTIWADMGLKGIGWTVLCPTDEAFKGINLTALYADTPRLTELVLQHLVPLQQPSRPPPDIDFFEIGYNNRPLVLDDSTKYATLLSRKQSFDYEDAHGDVDFRVVDGEGIVVGVDGARGADGKRDWAHVASWGRSTQGRGTGGVVSIDRVLTPYHPPWRAVYGGPITVSVLGVLLIGVFFYGVRILWKRDTTEATYEPIGGFGNNDDES